MERKCSSPWALFEQWVKLVVGLSYASLERELHLFMLRLKRSDIVTSDGLSSATRFSKYVSKFYKLPVPIPGDEASLALYVNEMVSIAAKEDIDYFIPCSGAGTTVEDAKAAQYMSEQSNGRVQSFIASPDLTKVLHEKVRFSCRFNDHQLTLVIRTFSWSYANPLVYPHPNHTSLTTLKTHST